MTSRLLALVSLIVFASGCTAQKTAAPNGWERFESSELGVKAAFPCKPEATTGLPGMSGDPNVISLSCEANGLRFLITRRNHLNPYSNDTPDEVFDSNRELLKSIFGKPSEFSESDSCQSVDPCRIYDLSLASVRVRSMIVVTKAATIEAMVATVPSGSASAREESLSTFDATSKEFLGALEVSK